MLRIFLVILFITSLFSVAVFTNVGDQLALVAVSQTSAYSDCLDKIKERYPNHSTEDSYQVTREKIDTNSTPDLVFTMIGSDTCGNSGCIHEICLRDGDTSQLIDFGMAAKAITVQSGSSEGMYDLALETSNKLLLTWDGGRYIIAN